MSDCFQKTKQPLSAKGRGGGGGIYLLDWDMDKHVNSKENIMQF